MKTKIKKELHLKTLAEFEKLLKDARDELFLLRMQKAQKKLKNTRMIFEKRKDIAKILTILNEKELAAALKSKAGDKE